MKEISVGSVVHLNSGSPDLRVIAANGETRKVDVEWDGESGEVLKSTFPVACLTA